MREKRSPEEKADRRSRRLRRLAVLSVLCFFVAGLLLVDLAYSRMTEEEGAIINAFSDSVETVGDSVSTLAEWLEVFYNAS